MTMAEQLDLAPSTYWTEVPGEPAVSDEQAENDSLINSIEALAKQEEHGAWLIEQATLTLKRRTESWTTESHLS